MKHLLLLAVLKYSSTVENALELQNGVKGLSSAIADKTNLREEPFSFCSWV
jgi:hypothetical protein